ncbi:MAG: ZIP family metal transporter [Candidatus Paceibacterota bacterium]
MTTIPLLYSLISVLIISLISLIGIFSLSVKESTIRKYVFVFVSLALGALLGDAFIHLIPEAIEETGDLNKVSLFVIIGIFIFFILEKFLHWHHHQTDSEKHIKPVGKMILISDGFHNFIDGVIIGASYLISVEVGIATTIAVLLHEIPQEIGDYGVLIHAGYTKSRALFLNFVSALISIVGVISVFLIGDTLEGILVWFLPIAAGGFIYIALSDLIPELHDHAEDKKDIWSTLIQIFVAIAGVGLMYGLLFLE